MITLGACPLLCGGHGDYQNGECICHPGWKGKECSLRHDECEKADCSGRGRCAEGRCQCIKGYTGEFCEKGKIHNSKQTVMNNILEYFTQKMCFLILLIGCEQNVSNLKNFEIRILSIFFLCLLFSCFKSCNETKI